jgi:hypothetical protein
VPPIRHHATAPVDDEQLFLRDHGDHRRRRHAPDAVPTRPHLELRRVVRALVRQDPLHRAVAAACEVETDAVGEPVAGDGIGRREPLALA